MKLLLSFLFYVLLLSCTNKEPASVENSFYSSINPSIVWYSAGKLLASEPESVYQIRFTISSAGLSNPITRIFLYKDHEGEISGIPTGLAAEISIEGLDTLGLILFSGTVSVEKIIGSEMEILIPAEQLKPISPVEFSASAFSSTIVFLSWKDRSYNEDYFVIKRLLDDGLSTFDSIAAVGANVESFADSNLLPESKYIYKIAAVNAAGKSYYSTFDTVTTPAIGINNPPVFITKVSEMLSLIELGLEYKDTVKAVDSDSGHTVSYTLVSGPSNMIVESMSGNISWMPESSGIYNVNIQAFDDSSGTALLSWYITVEDTALLLGFNPDNISVAKSQGFSVDLIIKNSLDVFSLTSKIVFDTSMLIIAEDSISQGNFFSNKAISIFKIDGDTITIGLTLVSGANSVDGDGSLAELKFGTKTTGISELFFSERKLNVIGSNGNSVQGRASLIMKKCTIKVN